MSDNVVKDAQFDELEERITLEALDSIFQRIPAASYKIIPLPLMVIAVMWSQVDHGLLMAWGLLVLTSIVIRYSVAVDFLRKNVHFKEAQKWGRRFSLASLFSGVIWSAAAFLFYVSGSVEHQVFIFALIITLSISSVIVGAYWFPSFYLFAVPTFCALSVRLLMEGTSAYFGLAVLLMFYLLVTVSLCKELRKSMRSEMRLRHESHALAEALQLKTEEAQKAVKAKSQFLAAASHDLRQPLHALSLFVDALKDSKSETERANIFPRIELSLDALRRLFDALLDMSRLDAHVVIPETSHFDIAEFLNEIAEEFKSEASEKNLKLKVHARSLIVETDRLLLERVLRNLISNALRYTDSGGVLLSARLRGNKVLLQVWDTGIGIPEESKEDIFIEFQQLHNSHRDRTQGLGLGLALVRRLCELLGHTLVLSSQSGKGSVFSIVIPEGRACMVISEKVEPVMHSWNLSERYILVIDDERDILQAMQTILLKWGCNVVIAESLADAVNELDERNIVPEIVLSDLRLRDNKTGIEAIDGLRERFGASLPGVLITGDTSPEQIKMAKLSGYEVLQKPVRPAHLRTVIFHHLSSL